MDQQNQIKAIDINDLLKIKDQLIAKEFDVMTFSQIDKHIHEINSKKNEA